MLTGWQTVRQAVVEHREDVLDVGVSTMSLARLSQMCLLRWQLVHNLHRRLYCKGSTDCTTAYQCLPADTINEVCCSSVSICLRAAGAVGASGGLGTN